MSVEILVSGYASVDESYHSSRLAGAAQTGVLTGPVRPEGRPGGCGPNTARVLARLGMRAGVVTWLGDDPQGRAFVTGLAELGVDVAGVEIGPGPSPRSLLIYDPDGDAACYFHPSGSARQRVSAGVLDRLRDASWLAITVGAPELTEQLLAHRALGTRLAWNVKADAHAFPPVLCERLIHADLVCLNHGELAFLADALGMKPSAKPPDLLARGARCVVLTRGASGYAVTTADGTFEGRVEPVTADDPTGAGDAFFAGFLAAVLRGAAPLDAAAAGARAARDFLMTRSTDRAPEDAAAAHEPTAEART
jgi:2-dehydro-3-deoxygluconokinase